MNVIIREKQIKDCAAVSRVVTISWQETYRGIVNQVFLDNLPNTEEDRTKKAIENFNKDNTKQFVLEVDGNVVGFISIGQTEDKAYQDCGEIFSLYIIGKFKGHGCGRKLFQKGIEQLRKMGYKKILIGCLNANPSNEFYKHLGGRLVKTRIFNNTGDELIENVYYFDIQDNKEAI